MSRKEKELRERDTGNGQIDVEHGEMSGLDVENGEIAKQIDGKSSVYIWSDVE